LFQALLASRAVVASARKDEHSYLVQSAEKLRLVEEINALKKENEALENLRGSLKSENELLKGKVSKQEETIAKMQEKMNLDESVLENLRSVVEKDAVKVVNLQTEVRQLKANVEKKWHNRKTRERGRGGPSGMGVGCPGNFEQERRDSRGIRQGPCPFWC